MTDFTVAKHRVSILPPIQKRYASVYQPMDLELSHNGQPLKSTIHEQVRRSGYVFTLI